jgi:hypothetical protein
MSWNQKGIRFRTAILSMRIILIFLPILEAEKLILSLNPMPLKRSDLYKSTKMRIAGFREGGLAPGSEFHAG